MTTITVSSGVTSRGLVVSSGGELDVLRGGNVVSTTVLNDGRETIKGGSATFDVVSRGGVQEIASSGVAEYALLKGGDQFVDSAGFASGTVVGSGGELFVSTYGGLEGATVGSGGRLYAHGVEAGTIVLSGGVEYVYANHYNYGGGDTVSGGGQIFLYGQANVETVAPGGRLNVLAQSNDDTVDSGGAEIVSSGGGFVFNATLAGGKLDVYGVASATNVSGTSVEYVFAGGVTNSTIVSSGGNETVESGGVASQTVVRASGQAFVLSGGLASGTMVSSGGAEFVLSGAVGSGETVSGGGVETISAGGEVRGLAVQAGGVLIDDGEVFLSGATTLGNYPWAGALSGSGLVVDANGEDLVLSGSGAGFSGGAVIKGGTIELATSGAIGAGYVQFVAPATGSAVLQIDAADAPGAGGTFANEIFDFSGANEDIDLRGVAFVAGATATVSGGTLVLSDGGATYRFKLAGSIAGAYPVLSDGDGGTLIDPVPAAAHTSMSPKVLAFAHAAAAFAPLDASQTALVSSASPTGQTAFPHATASAGGR